MRKKTRTQISLAGAQTRHDKRVKGDTGTLTPHRFADGSEPMGLRTCQFVLGDDYRMCGEPGFPYCPTHYAVCYRKAGPLEAA